MPDIDHECPGPVTERIQPRGWFEWLVAVAVIVCGIVLGALIFVIPDLPEADRRGGGSREDHVRAWLMAGLIWLGVLRAIWFLVRRSRRLEQGQAGRRTSKMSEWMFVGPVSPAKAGAVAVAAWLLATFIPSDLALVGLVGVIVARTRPVSAVTKDELTGNATWGWTLADSLGLAICIIVVYALHRGVGPVRLLTILL